MPDSEDAYRLILGRNISGDRGRLQLSQTAVATRMRDLGFEDWHQQTVASVEKGKRRVTVEEVLGLVLALETTLPRLLGPIGGDLLWIELPSGSGHLLPGMDVFGLANGAKGGTGSVSWYKNATVRAPISPREVERMHPDAIEPIPVEEALEQPVATAIVTSDLGVLVGRRNDGKPPWTFIAGEVEPGESPADAAIREVKEETGLRVEVGDVIGERVHPKTGRTMIYMAATPTHGTDIFVGDEDELAEVRWVSLREADELMAAYGMFGPVHEYLSRELEHGEQ